MFGVSYKPGVGDVRESPALKIISLLRELGAEVCYHDPHVPALAELGLASTPLEEALADADLALIVTAHPSVDHELIATRARLVVDLRGVTRASSAARTSCGCERRRRARPRARERAGGRCSARASSSARASASAPTWSSTTATVIGDGCAIEDHAVLGKRPRLARALARARRGRRAASSASGVTRGRRRGRVRRRARRRGRDPRRPVVRARAQLDRRAAR